MISFLSFQCDSESEGDTKVRLIKVDAQVVGLRAFRWMWRKEGVGFECFTGFPKVEDVMRFIYTGKC